MNRARTDERRAELEVELRLPDFPEPVRYLWDKFHTIRAQTTGNGFGPGPIGWGALDSFVRLSGVRLAPWEVEIITALDQAWLRIQYENKE